MGGPGRHQRNAALLDAARKSLFVLSLEKTRLHIVKIGGNVIDQEKELQAFLEKFHALEGKKILVHGGGKLATQMAQSMGMEAKMVEGRRITDAPTLRLVTMVYAGWINKNITAQLQALKCPSMGLSGADAGLILCQKRAPKPIDFGFVGDVIQVNGDLLVSLLELNLNLVIAPITADAQGQLLNTNADTIAQALAEALAKTYEVELLYCFEKKGVLMNAEDDASVIHHLDETRIDDLKAQHLVSDGMIPKLDNALKALKAGVHRVRILHARDLLQAQEGTEIQC